MARKIKRRPRKQDIGDFLPAAPDIVKAIAMQGTTDDELAKMFGLNPVLIQKWRKYYPEFDKALEEGRTVADAEVIQALHKKAVGYTRTYDISKMVGKGNERALATVTLEEEISPETNAIKFWLSNRDPTRWSERRHIQIGGRAGDPPIQSETRVELMSSILSLIQPKPDG